MADIPSSKLVILGGGRFGHELAAWIRFYDLPFTLVGFLDNGRAHEPVLSAIASHVRMPDTRYVTAIGSPDTRQEIVASVAAQDLDYANIISPLATSTSRLDDARGVVVLGDASIANNVRIGDHTLIHGGAIVGHDVTIGPFATIGALVFIGGGATIGEGVTLHPHATILPNVTVGAHATVGAGSVVIRNVEPGTTVAGNPATFLARRKS